MEVPPWFRPLRRSGRGDSEGLAFNDYRKEERFFTQEEKLWFCSVHNGDIKCDDVDVRKLDKERPAKGISEKKVIKHSDRAWYGNWQIPQRTFEDWMVIHRDPNKGFRSAPGNPCKLDPEAKLEMQKEMRDLHFGTDGNGPRPPKTSKVHEIMIKAAENTLKRTGMKVCECDTVTIAMSTEALYRSELSHQRTAADLTDARYKALSDMQHIF